MSDIAKPHYCRCATPVYFANGKLRYCRHCWLQPSPPSALPAPHNMSVLREWALHSRKRGMEPERISRDLRLDLKTVRFLLGRGNDTAAVGKAP